MIKHLLALAAAAALASPAFAAPAAPLATGDLAFTSFNADEDGFSLVTFVNLSAGTKIFFSDNEWNGLAIGSGGAFNTGEGFNEWTSTNAIAAGTVIRFSAVDKATASAPNFARTGTATLALGNSNETVYAYLGSSTTAPTTFLAAITNSSWTAADGQLAGTGLTAGTSQAIRLNEFNTSATPDFGEYVGSRGPFSNVAAAKAALGDVKNWTVDTVNGAYATTVPNVTGFTVTAVPEPETYALMLAGLAAVSFMARRRSA